MWHFCNPCTDHVYHWFNRVFIQFGLDQLLDAPSHYPGLYIHYILWVFSFAPAIVMTAETFLSYLFQ